jgi:uncharacterized protein YcaQ
VPPLASPWQLSARDARRVQLAAQGLLGRRPTGGPASVLAQTRGVQLDTISVLARSHELVAFARLGAVPRERIEADYWGGPPYAAFEYWYHAACVLPIEEWPNLAFKRAARREKGFRWHRVEDLDKSCKAVLNQLRERGPLTAKELGGAKRGGPWWDWSETKIAAEWLLDIGEVVCTARRGFQRVYDLPERAIPLGLHEARVPKPDAVRVLVERAAGALGVATAADLASYTGLKRVDVTACLEASRLEPAVVEGWKDKAFVAPNALEHKALGGRPGARGASVRPVMLSPFDSLICDRARVERLFGFHHRLEAYVPRPKRIHGYYAMPVLVGDRLVARVDPARDGSTLVARSVHLESSEPAGRAARAVGAALIEAAKWVKADAVAIERVEPPEARDAVLAAVT